MWTCSHLSHLGTRERHLESILQSTLRQIILIQNFPRTLIQVSLQIMSTPENENAGSKLVQAASVFAYVTGQLD
jgi:exosome complex component RRP46